MKYYEIYRLLLHVLYTPTVCHDIILNYYLDFTNNDLFHPDAQYLEQLLTTGLHCKEISYTILSHYLFFDEICYEKRELDYQIIYDTLSDALHVNDISNHIISNYLCDQIYFFSFPAWLQRYVEDKFCVSSVYYDTHYYYLFGKLHGPGDKPAIHDGDNYYDEWYKNDEPYRANDLPTDVDNTGTMAWRNFIGYHRDNDKPAFIEKTSEQWFQNGRLHRDNDLPAHVEKHNQYKAWYRHGILHRDNDQPAIMSDCFLIYYQNGVTHRDNDLPACIYQKFTAWYRNGMIHREGGLPAIVFKDGLEICCENNRIKSWNANDEFRKKFKIATLSEDDFYDRILFRYDYVHDTVSRLNGPELMEFQ